MLQNLLDAADEGQDLGEHVLALNLLDAADDGQDLWEHVLVLVLVVHVHAGQEHVVGGVGVDPAQQDNILSENEKTILV